MHVPNEPCAEQVLETELLQYKEHAPARMYIMCCYIYNASFTYRADLGSGPVAGEGHKAPLIPGVDLQFLLF